MANKRLTDRDILQLVEDINNQIDEPLSVDAGKINGARAWRIGKPGQMFRDMSEPTYSTTELYHYLSGFLARQSMPTYRYEDIEVSPNANTASIRYMPGYVSPEGEYAYLFSEDDEEGGFKIVNRFLERGAYYMFRLTSDGEQDRIDDVRVMSPFDLPALDSVSERTDLSIPNIGINQRNGIYYPVVNPTFHIPADQRPLFKYIFSKARYITQRMLMIGPPGTGKTSAPEQYAAEMGMGVFKLSCGLMESTSEFFGVRTIDEDGNVVWLKSAFVEALETPNMLIIMDEVNRVPPTAMNSLFNLFDDSQQTFVDQDLKQSIRVASGVVIVGTANIGASHTGTFILDSALTDRFPIKVRMNYLPVDQEIKVLIERTGVDHENATRLVEVANEARAIANDEASQNPIDKPISLRQLLACAEMLAGGMPPVESANFTIFQDYSIEGGEESPQASIRELFQGKFGVR